MQASEYRPNIPARGCEVLEVDGLRFRDLNGNGRLDPYEDWRNPPEARVADLLERMTEDEKIGQMFTFVLDMGEPVRDLTEDHRAQLRVLLDELHIGELKNRTTFERPDDWAAHASWHNAVQEEASTRRLGIPVMFYTMPKWDNPPLALAATRDTDLARRWAEELARRLRSIGIHEIPEPLLCVATEPRWRRTDQTFGEYADLCSAMIVAVMKGLQGPVPSPA